MQIGDSLTVNQLNGYLNFFREFIKHSESIKLKSETVGEYGDYLLDIPYAVIVDNGFLITGQTLTAEPKVKLTNNVFKSSTYILTLKVLHYTDVSVFDDEPDYEVIEDMKIELVPDTWVDIPLSDIEEGYIICFDAKVNIKHDKTEVQGNYVTGLGLSVDKPVIQIGEDAVLTILATDLDTLPVVGKTISLYDGGTLLDNLTTDSTGIATKTITGTGTGRHEYIAKYKNTVQSTSTGLLDTIFYDQAITDHKNTNWNNFSNRLTVVTDENGTQITSNGSANGYYFVNGDDPFIFTDYTVEFDVISFGGTPRWYHQNENSANENVFNLSTYITDGCHVKITVTEGTANLYVDGVQKTTATLSVSGSYEIAFRLGNAVTNTITYANFMVYPYSNEQLVLTTEKQTISAYNSETTTLTATYVGGSGATVKLYNASDDTLIATMNDEDDGTYTYTHTSTGAGDISFYAKVNDITSDEITVEDCLYYEQNEVSYVSSYTSGDHSIKLDSDFTIALPLNCEISIDVKSNINGSRLQLSSNSKYSSSTSNYGFGMNRDGTAMNCYYRTTSSNTWGSTIPHDTNYHNYKFVKSGTSVEAFLDNTSKGSQTFSWIDTYTDYTWIWWVWKNGTITAKNIKIKAL